MASLRSAKLFKLHMYMQYVYMYMLLQYVYIFL